MNPDDGSNNGIPSEFFTRSVKQSQQNKLEETAGELITSLEGIEQKVNARMQMRVATGEFSSNIPLAVNEWQTAMTDIDLFLDPVEPSDKETSGARLYAVFGDRAKDTGFLEMLYSGNELYEATEFKNPKSDNTSERSTADLTEEEIDNRNLYIKEFQDWAKNRGVDANEVEKYIFESMREYQEVVDASLPPKTPSPWDKE